MSRGAARRLLVRRRSSPASTWAMTSTRSTPPRLRRLLLDAARELLRDPDTRLDLRKVAERAGKSRTAPYLVFGKERDRGGIFALRIAVAADGAEELSRRMEEASQISRDPLEAFTAVAEEVLAFTEENPRLFRLMFGAGTRALSAGLGADGLRDHPEFQAFLEGRERAERVVADLVVRAQRQGLLQADSTAGLDDSDAEPSRRSVGIAWSTMIGVAVLRQDELLQGTQDEVSRDRGARWITEAVFGIDPGVVEDAWRSLRQAAGPESFPATSPGRPSRPTSPPRAAPPPAGAPATSETDRPAADASRPGGGDWLPGLLKDLVPLNNPTAAAREILKRLDLKGGEGGEEPSQASGGAPREGAPEVEGGRPEEEADTTFVASIPASSGSGPSLTRVLRSHSGLRRAAYEARRLRGAPVLWVDGRPEEREAEAELLRTLGLHLVRALDVEEAFRRIDRQNSSALGPFRAILCDLTRGSRWRPGTETVTRLGRTAPDTPIIVYVPTLDRTIGVPRGAVGITDSPDELLHLLLDALGRVGAPESS